MDKEAKADALLKEAIDLVGEEKVGELLQETSNAAIQMALSTLHSSKWWLDTIQQALVSPKEVNTLLLNNLINKAVPTPQSVRVGADEGFKLTVEHITRGE